MTTMTKAELHAWSTVRFSTEAAILLVTIIHPELETQRLARNTDDVESRGETFRAAWFEVDWVNNDGNAPRCELSVPNVNYREIGQRYLYVRSRPKVILELVASGDPDVLIGSVRHLELQNVKPDPLFVTGTLAGKDHSTEPLGKIVVLPSNFSALFRRQRKL